MSGFLLFWTKFLSVFAKSTLPDGVVPDAPDEKLTVFVLLNFLLTVILFLLLLIVSLIQLWLMRKPR